MQQCNQHAILLWFAIFPPFSLKIHYEWTIWMSQSDSIVHIYLSNHNISPRFRRINYVWVFTLIVNLKLKFDARVYGSMRSPFFFSRLHYGTMELWQINSLLLLLVLLWQVWKTVITSWWSTIHWHAKRKRANQWLDFDRSNYSNWHRIFMPKFQLMNEKQH